MNHPLIVLAGVTGNLGGRIARALRQRGASVRAIVRPGTSEARLLPLRGKRGRVFHRREVDQPIEVRAPAKHTVKLEQHQGRLSGQENRMATILIGLNFLTIEIWRNGTIQIGRFDGENQKVTDSVQRRGSCSAPDLR